MNLTRSVSVLVVLGVVLSAGIASAQYQSGSYALSYGNTNAGGTIDIYGYKQHTSTFSEAYGRISGTVRILGNTREAGRVTALSRQSYGSSTGNLTVRIAGMTVWTQSLTYSGSRSYSNLLNAFNPAPTAVFWVGPVPVTTTGNIGLGVNLGLSWAFAPATMSAGLNGSAAAWGYGTATAALGVPGYNVGIQATLNFANHSVGYGINVSNYGTNGYMSYSRQALVLAVNLIVNAWPFNTWTHNLVTWSTPSYYDNNVF